MKNLKKKLKVCTIIIGSAVVAVAFAFVMLGERIFGAQNRDVLRRADYVCKD